MATSISKTGHVKNTVQLEQNDELATTGTSSSYAGIVNTVDTMDKLINERKAKQERIAKLHPGYLPDKYQDSITQTKIEYKYAQQGWKQQNYVQFPLQVNQGNRYNPSTAKFRIKFRLRSAAGGDLPNNVIPVENFENKFIQKVRIENMGTKDDINRAVEYRSDLLTLAENFFYDSDVYKHEDESRNQLLCESIGRRTRANASNKRLDQRMQNHNLWKTKTEWIIDCSKLDDFFKINHPLWTSVMVTFFFETNQKKLFEAKPAANVPNDQIYAEPAKIVFDESFTPQLFYTVTTMSQLYNTEDNELYETNKMYDLGEYNKITVEQKNMAQGAQNCTVFLRGLTNRIEFLCITVQSLTGQEHGSVYDSTMEDQTLKLVEKIIIKNLYNPNGTETKTFILDNDIQNRSDLMELYGGFRRFVCGAPNVATVSALKHTEYLRNLPTEADYLSRRSAAKANTDGCFPVCIDCTDSKGLFDDADDDPSFVSPLIEVELVFKQNATRDYNIVLTAFQKGKYILSNVDKIPSIKKI